MAAKNAPHRREHPPISRHIARHVHRLACPLKGDTMLLVSKLYFASPLWGEAGRARARASVWAGEGALGDTSLLLRSRVLRHPEFRSRRFSPSPGAAQMPIEAAP